MATWPENVEYGSKGDQLPRLDIGDLAEVVLSRGDAVFAEGLDQYELIEGGKRLGTPQANERILTTGQYAESAMTALRGVVDSEYGGAAVKMATPTN